ncbi:MAG: alginate export family protein [Alphaproteobacteria bacterium]|nr:alginate export family protein [Alphaproteobacteria bacterium]
MPPESLRGDAAERWGKYTISGGKTVKKYLLGTAFLALTTTPAIAGKPIPIGNGVTLTPSYDARLRYESVDQDNALQNADAVTARLRAGIELGLPAGFSLFAEAEGTLAVNEDYNSTTNGKTTFSTVADPENIELNQAFLKFKGIKGTTITAGRQRINLDDQRFVGSVGWRQNEQTFDAARVESTIGPVMIDATYAWSDRTIFGIDAGTRQAFSGDNVFVTAGAKVGPAVVKGFAFLVDQDEPGRFQFSSQTYGGRATAAFALTKKAKLSLVASYATQSDYNNSTVDYKADYYMADATLDVAGFSLNGNYEVLGSDDGVFAFQTPLATLHKFQGWADLFLVTPANGIQDLNFSLSKKFSSVKAIPGLMASVTWHKFESDFGNVDYGQEWDAQIGFKILKTAVLVKYANYDADAFSVDTEKFWLQLGWTF